MIEYSIEMESIVMTKSENHKFFDPEYADYWLKKTDKNISTPKSELPGDTNILFDYLGKLNLKDSCKVLDVGCGHGRLLKDLKKNFSCVQAIDYSYAAIELAKKTNQNISLLVGEAESLPFTSNSIDVLICWAVFDGIRQEEAFREFIRILRPGGYLALTGKRYEYCRDDTAAIAAEKGARRKGFPGSYTRFPDFIRVLEEAKIRLVNQVHFPKRGDAAILNLVDGSLPQRSYEYFIVVQKTEDTKLRNFSFSERHSDVCDL